MKKRFLKGTVLAVAVAAVGIFGVSARTSIYSNTSYSIASGATKNLTRKFTAYTGAEAEVTPFSANNGTKKTTMRITVSGSTVYEDTKSYSTTTCTYFTIGSVRTGAIYYNSAEGYAGWSGWLKITAN